MADTRPSVVEGPTERAQAFVGLADRHLDAAYRLRRKWSTLRDPSRFEPLTAWPRQGLPCAKFRGRPDVRASPGDQCPGNRMRFETEVP
jgi:hypothetical protein